MSDYPQGLYRPGSPFSAAELQTMASEKVLHHLLLDVYAEATLRDDSGLRATAAWSLLAPTLRAHSVLCGETAAWIHHAGPAPRRVTVITDGVFRRPTSAAWWAVHQVPLDPHHWQRHAGIPVTTAVRTAADLFCGVGAPGGRGSMDRLVHQHRDVPTGLRGWPTVREPLAERDMSILHPSAADGSGLRRRALMIADLTRRISGAEQELVDMILQLSSIEAAAPSGQIRRAEAVRQIVTQCVSRRLPTVR